MTFSFHTVIKANKNIYNENIKSETVFFIMKLIQLNGSEIIVIEIMKYTTCWCRYQQHEWLSSYLCAYNVIPNWKWMIDFVD